MASKRYASVNRKICVACGACTKECPKEAISVYRGCYALVDKDGCIGCGKCAALCPAGCISIIPREEVL